MGTWWESRWKGVHYFQTPIGNGKHTTYNNGDLGMVQMALFHHVLPAWMVKGTNQQQKT